MSIRRYLIACLLIMLTPIFSLTTEPSTVEEFTEALKPSEVKEASSDKTKYKTRGLGGTLSIDTKPNVAMHLIFSLDSAELNNRSKAVLNKLGRALEKETLRGYIYQLEGHTCDRGTAEHNYDLSRRRALSVRNYLSSYFDLDSQQFITIWFGETKPVVPNTDETARRQNRRVVIINTLKTFYPPIVTQQPAILQVKCIRDNKEDILADGDTLMSHDRYAVAFLTTADLNVYVYQVDSTGQMSPLFPNPNFTTTRNPVAAQTYQRLLGENRWFHLDTNTGREQVILLAAKDSLNDPGDLCLKIASGKIVDGMVVKTENTGIRIRSLGGSVQEEPSGNIGNNDFVEDDSVDHTKSDVFVVQRYFLHK